jgi:hypothetical protein
MPLSFFVLTFAPFILDSFERKRELWVFHALMKEINEKIVNNMNFSLGSF